MILIDFLIIIIDQVSGTETTSTGEINDFHYLCKSVVVATGVFDQSNRLNVPGENRDFVYHSMKVYINDLIYIVHILVGILIMVFNINCALI